jgi:hypothetical protein
MASNITRFSLCDIDLNVEFTPLPYLNFDANGSNKYKIPHMNKKRLERGGQLPTQVKCNPMLVQDVLNYLI